MAHPDYRMYPHIFNVVAQKGEHMPAYFDSRQCATGW